MNKPITILIKEFNQNICDTVNNSQLPMWKVKDELEKIMAQVKNACIEEEKIEYEKYQQQLALEEKRKERVGEDNGISENSLEE